MSRHGEMLRVTSRLIIAGLFVVAVTYTSSTPAWADQKAGPLESFKDSPSNAREMGDPSAEITIREFIDATSSMRGFVEHGNTGLAQQLREMEQASRLAWANVKNIECFKFGTKIIPEPLGTVCYSAVARDGFFRLPKDQDYTRIDPILSNADDKSLTVIITDLFEDEADLGSVFQNVKESVFKRGLALGIAGMRVGFNGMIYDIGIEKGKKPWDRQRPVYALVIGRVADVEAYFAELAPRIVPSNQLLILSGILLMRPVTWASTIKSRTAGTTIDSSPSFINVVHDASSFGMVRLQNPDKCELDLHLDTKPSRFHPNIDWTKVHPRILVKRFPRSSGVPEKLLLEDDWVAGVISANRDGLVTLHLSWQPKRLNPHGRVFVEQVSIPLEGEDVDLTQFPFIREWDTTPTGDSLAGFNGGKTQYLSEFVSGLWKSLVQVERPDLGAIYIYFQP